MCVEVKWLLRMFEVINSTTVSKRDLLVELNMYFKIKIQIISSKLKIKIFQSLIKHHAMQEYWGVDV
jgi:hypothetical protein